MIKKERMILWLPVKEFESEFFVKSVIEDAYGLVITLVGMENRKRELVITFGNGVRSYRMTDEICSIHALQGDVEITDDSEENICLPLYKVIDSEYLEWEQKQNYSHENHQNLIHFAISTIEVTLEILCWYEPHVTIIELP